MAVIPAEIQNRHLADTTTALLLEPTSRVVSGQGSGISNDHLYPEVKKSMIYPDLDTHLADYTVSINMVIFTSGNVKRTANTCRNLPDSDVLSVLHLPFLLPGLSP
jgi:hypothetical protein